MSENPELKGSRAGRRSWRFCIPGRLRRKALGDEYRS